LQVYRVDCPRQRRQYLSAYLEGLAGTRLGGFVITRQASPGKWGAATYKLQRTGPDAPYDPYAFRHRRLEKTEGALSEKTLPALTLGIGGTGGIGSPSSEKSQDGGGDDTPRDGLI
jgi:hypothetical protein